MTEAAITEAILRWLRRQGAHVIKTYGGPYRRGLPDIIGVYRGRALALEVKRPGGKPTELQQYELERWAAAGAVAGVVTCVEDAKQLLWEVDANGTAEPAGRRAGAGRRGAAGQNRRRKER